jgi:GAF domain-containing protein
MRTQERVLLDDASADLVYSKDEYVRQRGSKSILCLPIVKQRTLVGALYLENNLTPFVFTPDRVALLQLLASQAAISLENACLYSNLELQAGLLQRLPVSAWTLDPDGTPDFVNQVWLEYSGQTLAQGVTVGTGRCRSKLKRYSYPKDPDDSFHGRYGLRYGA